MALLKVCVDLNYLMYMSFNRAIATPRFRDRGLAALRRGEDGTINLDLGTHGANARTLRVRLQERGSTVASAFDIGTVQPDDASIEGAVLQARNSLFDEELFHELHREARISINRGIQCINGTIILPLDLDRVVILDLISTDEKQVATTMELDEPRDDEDLPQFIILALRILLCHAHRQNYKRRSNIPLPLTERRPPRPMCAMLRPILAHFSYHSCARNMQKFLLDLSRAFAPPTLTFNVEAMKVSTKGSSD